MHYRGFVGLEGCRSRWHISAEEALRSAGGASNVGSRGEQPGCTMRPLEFDSKTEAWHALRAGSYSEVHLQFAMEGDIFYQMFDVRICRFQSCM